MPFTRRSILLAALWLAAFGVAFLADRPVAEWVQRQGWDVHRALTPTHHVVNFVLKVPGEYLFTLALAVVLALAHPGRWRAGVVVAVAGGGFRRDGVGEGGGGRVPAGPGGGVHPV